MPVIARPAGAPEVLTNTPRLTVTPPPAPSPLLKPAEAPVYAAIPPVKTEPAAPPPAAVVPAAQTEQPPKIAVAPVVSKPPPAPAKAAPPHFLPRAAVTNESAAVLVPREVPFQKPAAVTISETPIYRPMPVEPARSKELRAANFVWFGAGLVLVGLVSFGYPAVRGRLDGAIAKVPKFDVSRFVPRRKDSSDRIRLNTTAVVEAMTLAEKQFAKETPPFALATTPKPEAPTDHVAPVVSAPETPSAEPLADSQTSAAPPPAPTATEQKLDQPPVDSMKLPHPKPRAPHKEESPEERERRLAALKELLGVKPVAGQNTETQKNGTPDTKVNDRPADTGNREQSSTAVPSAS